MQSQNQFLRIHTSHIKMCYSAEKNLKYFVLEKETVVQQQVKTSSTFWFNVRST